MNGLYLRLFCFLVCVQMGRSCIRSGTGISGGGVTVGGGSSSSGQDGTGTNTETDSVTGDVTSGNDDETTALSGCPTIISRTQWGARAPIGKISSMKNTPQFVVIHHGAGAACNTADKCKEKVQEYQTHHIDNNKWRDIGYNFVVGEDGNVYEGRGWGKIGAHASGVNGISLGICVIGDFGETVPNEAAQSAVKQLIRCAKANGKLLPTYTIRGHRDLKETKCPGQNFYDLIKTWSRYSESNSVDANTREEGANSVSNTDSNDGNTDNNNGNTDNNDGNTDNDNGNTDNNDGKTNNNNGNTEIDNSNTDNNDGNTDNNNGNTDDNGDNTDNNVVCPTIISRADWGARAPRRKTPMYALPTYVLIHHGAGKRCDSKSTCTSTVQGYQNLHMDNNNWIDIGYNFIVGEDGNVYEGRGWGIVGAHAGKYSFNKNSLGICVIGEFSNSAPNEAALTAIQQLISCSVAKNKLASSYKLRGHRDVKSTLCPGTSLYNVIKTWPKY